MHVVMRYVAFFWPLFIKANILYHVVWHVHGYAEYAQAEV